MRYEHLERDFRGVNVVTATPFTGDGEEVRYDAIRENVGTLVDAGMELFIPCGGVSEYYSLSTEERVGVAEATVDAVGEAGSVVVVDGSTKDAADLIGRYERAGLDGVMLMFPQRPGLHRDGLSAHYRTLVESTELGVMLYKKDPRLDTELLDELAAYDNVVAVKHAVGDLDSLVRDVNDVSGDVVWVDGNAETLAVGYGLEGAEGFTTGIGNFVPELSLMDAIREEDWSRARRLRELARPFQDPRGEVPGSTGVGVVKHGLEVSGRYGGPVRPPLKPMAEPYRGRVERIYEAVSTELDAAGIGR